MKDKDIWTIALGVCWGMVIFRLVTVIAELIYETLKVAF